MEETVQSHACAAFGSHCEGVCGSELGRKAWRREKSLTLSEIRTLLKVQLCEFTFCIILSFYNYEFNSSLTFTFYLCELFIN